jgi:hypothetical protein
VFPERINAHGGSLTAEEMARIPEYIEVRKDGYVNKCDGFCPGLLPGTVRRPTDVLTVYAPDLHTVVGHFYNTKGYVPVGTNPADVPDVSTSTSTLTTTSTRPPGP